VAGNGSPRFVRDFSFIGSTLSTLAVEVLIDKTATNIAWLNECPSP
jgi:hypothetical protein